MSLISSINCIGNNLALVTHKELLFLKKKIKGFQELLENCIVKQCDWDPEFTSSDDQQIWVSTLLGAWTE